MGSDVKVYPESGDIAGPCLILPAGPLRHELPAGSRKRIAVAALVPSIALAGVMLALLPGIATAATSIDAGLAALTLPSVSDPAWIGADQSTAEPVRITVAAKGGRLLKNGTRSRSNDGKKEDSDAAKNPAGADTPAADSTAATPAAPPPAATAPVPASTNTKAAVSAPAPTGPVLDPTRSTTRVTGTGSNPGSITCVANCNRPPAAPSVTGGSIQCVAGCAGLQAATSRQAASSDVSSSMQASSGSAGGKITVMRGNTRVKVYSDGR